MRSRSTSILPGALAEDAQRSLDRLSRRLLRMPALLAPATSGEKRDERTRVYEPSLFGGAAGIAITHGVLERVFPGRKHARRAQRWITLAMHALAERPMQATFDPGFVGIAWAIQHIESQLHSNDDACASIDDALLGLLSSAESPWSGHFDLICGLVGMGIYALERLPRSSGERLFELVVARLAEASRRHRVGLAWETPLDLLPAAYGKLVPQPCFDLGLAHGTAGVVAVLAVGLSYGTGGEQARELLAGGVAFLLEQRLAAGAGAMFARYADSPVPARTAWCYGDPGVAMALLLGARAVGESRWERAALDAAHSAALRPPERTGVVGPGLCHGSAGLAHIFHRLHQMTGEPAFATAARRWIQVTLAPKPVGVDRPYLGDPAWLGGPGLLSGASGVALALCAALYPETAAWDRALLLSGR